jgi:hypothetical protein
MFLNYNDNVFQTTLNSLNESSTITIDYINKEVKLRKDSIEINRIKTKQLISEIKTTEDIHVHSKIIFLCISNIVFNFICHNLWPLLRIHLHHSW